MNTKIAIEICVGSSCFARGNNDLVQIIENYIASDVGILEKIEVKGRLCLNKCECGPHVFIDGKKFENITSSQLSHILSELI